MDGFNAHILGDEAPKGGGEAAVPDDRGLQLFPGGGSGEVRQVGL